MYLDGEEYLSIGSYLLVIGTFVSAVGETIYGTELENLNNKLIRDGNAVQALGNSFQGFGRISLSDIEEESNVYSIMGCFTQAGGNTLNSAATNLEIESPSAESTRLNSLGSSVQSMGAALEAYGLANSKSDYFIKLEVLGSSLISIAALLDSIGILARDENSLQKEFFLQRADGWSLLAHQLEPMRLIRKLKWGERLVDSFIPLTIAFFSLNINSYSEIINPVLKINLLI
ncbi:DUF6944 family repetitive protein [Bacillus sp. J33]|uniref:DUF6944 family repetitive protein n=1 Tax=Bacillus sp. J33 TaxID=935836 RepID=UPI0004B803C5|nr:hypothetical protein [Bacillus sp. J33]